MVVEGTEPRKLPIAATSQPASRRSLATRAPRPVRPLPLRTTTPIEGAAVLVAEPDADADPLADELCPAVEELAGGVVAGAETASLVAEVEVRPAKAAGAPSPACP